MGLDYDFKNQYDERTEKETDYRFFGPTDGQTGDVINNDEYILFL